MVPTLVGHQVEVDAPAALAHAGVVDRAEPGRDRGGLVLEVGCGERRAPAHLHLQLERGQPVAVPAVDARLAGVQRRQVTALAPGLLEVVPQHRGEQPTPAVVGMDARPR